MRNFRNYYEILGIAGDATADEIKRAFRRLARQYHPDLNPGDKRAEEQFKTIGEAYEVLSDTDKRAQYDQFSRYWKQKGFQRTVGRAVANAWAGRGGSTAPEVDYSQFPDFNTFVEELLGNGNFQTTANGRTRTAVRNSSTRPSSPRPSAARSTTRTTPRATASRASTPGATAVGAVDAYRPGTTKTAYTVKARPKRRDIEARLAVPLEKAYTGGRERVRLEDGRSIEVEMPSGMVSGQKIRLKGQGFEGGDLYFKIEVTPHAFYTLKAGDLSCTVPVTPAEAIVGAAIEIPTLDGPVKMNLPAGVQSGRRLRLANKGYPRPDGDRGDQIVEVDVVIPTELTAEVRELYEKISQIDAFKPRQKLL